MTFRRVRLFKPGRTKGSVCGGCAHWLAAADRASDEGGTCYSHEAKTDGGVTLYGSPRARGEEACRRWESTES